MTDSVASESASSLASTHRMPNGQQPRKLRDSCIHCANSKVKCNKEKPICSRCVRRRLDCEYKVSRRTGRTSRAVNLLSGMGTATGGIETSTTSPVLRPAGIGINTTPNVLSTLISGGPSRTPLLTPITTVPVAPSSPEHCTVQTPDLWRSLLSPSAFNADVGDLSSLMPMGTDIGDIFASVMASPQFDTCDIDSLPAHGILADAGSATEHGLFPTPGLSDARSAGPCDTTSADQKSCLTIVLDILKDLFPNAPTACKHPGSQQGPDKARSIDSVITENKQIINTINAVLDCPCSQDGYVISVISLAVFKVMGWYIAAARDQKPASEDGIGWGHDAPAYTGRGSPSAFDDTVFRSSTERGYYMDSRSQDRMAAQLVLSELHRVQRLVNVVSSRLESIRLSTCLSSASTFGSTSTADSVDNSLLAVIPTAPLSGSTFSQLEEDLRKRLRAISSETIEILRRE